MTLLTHWEGEALGTLDERWGVPRLEIHDRLSSTNDRLRELTEGGAEPFTTVLAELRRRLTRHREGLEREELAEFTSRDALRDQKIWSEVGGEGLARGLAPDGGLILERLDGASSTIGAGSVRVLGKSIELRAIKR